MEDILLEYYVACIKIQHLNFSFRHSESINTVTFIDRKWKANVFVILVAKHSNCKRSFLKGARWMTLWRYLGCCTQSLCLWWSWWTRASCHATLHHSTGSYSWCHYLYRDAGHDCQTLDEEGVAICVPERYYSLPYNSRKCSQSCHPPNI